MTLANSVKRFWRLSRQQSLDRLVIIVVLLIFLSAIAQTAFERNSGTDEYLTFYDWLWWSVVTLSTVGYGDVAPETASGRAIATMLILLGTGTLSVFTAAIASIFVQDSLNAQRGMTDYDFRNHIILCEWNYRAREIVSELRADPRTQRVPIVLIADIDAKPLDDDNLYFVKGKVNDETLRRAGIEWAGTAIIVGDDSLNATARDAQVVLATLTVETLRPEAYTVVELIDETNVVHCQRANADEVIVGSEFSTRLLARAVLDRGISKVVSEMLSFRGCQSGSQMRLEPVPAHYVGKTFFEVFVEQKRLHDRIILAIKESDSDVFLNPSADFLLKANSFFIVVSGER